MDTRRHGMLVLPSTWSVDRELSIAKMQNMEYSKKQHGMWTLKGMECGQRGKLFGPYNKFSPFRI